MTNPASPWICTRQMAEELSVQGRDFRSPPSHYELNNSVPCFGGAFCYLGLGFRGFHSWDQCGLLVTA
jgi:hypothetical protein